jgi:hypothetical protein
VSATAKEKEKEREHGPTRGERGRAAGRLGRKVRRVWFSFFFFSFSNSFLKQLFFSNSNQNSFKLFLKNL